MSNPKINKEVAAYYDGKLAAHGPSPRGVDWRDSDSQSTRFKILTGTLDLCTESSLLDYGCGYGALVEFLRAEGWQGFYCGYDLSKQMLEAAQEIHKTDENAVFSTKEPSDLHDFVVASGIFNVRLGWNNFEWTEYVFSTLDLIWEVARLGLSFNMLSSFSDPCKMRDDLYYASPSFVLEYCMNRYSKSVALFHNYGLYEFTVVVRK